MSFSQNICNITIWKDNLTLKFYNFSFHNLFIWNILFLELSLSRFFGDKKVVQSAEIKEYGKYLAVLHFVERNAVEILRKKDFR
jgi:hypothetical protein